MLPLDSRDLRPMPLRSSGAIDSRFPDYARRLLDFKQMDFESSVEQIASLFSSDPSKVYTSFYYRKQTKNQWARDDPAFAVVVACFVGLGSFAYALAFHNFSFWGYLWTVLYAIIVDWIVVAMVVASICSYLCNKYLRQHMAHTVEQEVEWMFSFDVHINAFLCCFLVTYVLQYFLLPLLLSRSFLACFVANTLYALGSVWYFYMTHLGYRALPFLTNTQVFFWYPSITVGVLWLFSTVLLVLGLRLNMTRIVMAFHYG